MKLILCILLMACIIIGIAFELYVEITDSQVIIWYTYKGQRKYKILYNKSVL